MKAMFDEECSKPRQDQVQRQEDLSKYFRGTFSALSFSFIKYYDSLKYSNSLQKDLLKEDVF